MRTRPFWPQAWAVLAAGALGLLALYVPVRMLAADPWALWEKQAAQSFPSPFLEYLAITGTHLVNRYSFLVFALCAVPVGLLFPRRKHLHLVMLWPLALDLVLDLALRPTAHNLWPFGIVFVWLPLAACSFVGSGLGRALRLKLSGGSDPRT